MRFESAKSLFVAFIIWTAVILMVFAGMLAIQQGGLEQCLLVILVLVAGMMIWSWFATYYDIENNELKYRSGPIHGKIPVNVIRIIVKNKTQFSGLKPALASNGCVVEYEKYNEIYLSPKDQDGFIAELLKINPAIKVIENK